MHADGFVKRNPMSVDKICEDRFSFVRGLPCLYLLLLVMAAAECLVASCGGSGEDSSVRGAAQAASLERIDDSMKVNSPSTLGMIQSGMRQAADSLDYYDYYLRYLRHVSDSAPAAAAHLNWNGTERYLLRQERTPRIRGMLAYLKNGEAGYLHKIHRDANLTIKLFHQAYDYSQGSDIQHNMPAICANLGDAYVFVNDMPSAATWYRRALFIADSLNLSKNDNLSLYMGLGRIYVGIGDYKSAAECYAKVDRNISLLSIGMQAFFLNNYGNYYYFKEEYAPALAVFKRLKLLLEANGMGEGSEMQICKINMADIYLNLDSVSLADRYLQQSAPFFIKAEDPTGLYYVNTIRMGIDLKSGKMADVRRILASEHIDERQIDFQLVNIRQRYLRRYYARTGDYRRAYDNLLGSVERNDSLKHNIENMRTYDIMTRYTQDTLQLHHHIMMQKKDADVRKARWGLWLGLLLAVMMVLLTLLIYTLSRKRKLDMDMQLMNLKLMNVRNRMSPHFIFNVLNNRISHTDKADADTLMELTKLIRANLSLSGKYLITLKEELDFVKYYISVERQCIEGGLTFVIDAPGEDALSRVMIPSMFIQILVENSIKHGLKGLHGEKKLTVRADISGDVCTVSVTDNGRGFDIRNTDPNSTGTGLKVIQTTISMLNRSRKRKIRMSVANLKDAGGGVSGCRTTIAIPLGLSENNN